MDFDQALLRLQGALSSFSVTTPDNEKLQTLSLLFQNVDETAKTKMVFFLILNTKMNTTNMLLNDGNYNLVSINTQNLDFPALSYIIFKLNLVGNLGEIVSNTPAALTVDLLTGVFAYACSRVQIRGLEKVIIGLFEKILKITKGIHLEYSHLHKLWEFLNIFGDMMWCSSSFENEELMEEDVNNILETCLICVNLYQDSTPISYNDTYRLKELRDKLPVDASDCAQPPDCKTRFLKYVSRLLDLFNEIFNSCIKYDPAESHTDVAENAFALYEKLENSDIEPSNLSHLNEIKRKPETELEKMAKSDIYTIIDKIFNSGAPEKWLRTLINFPHLIENEDALICLMKHLDFLESKDLMDVANIIHEQFKKHSISVIFRDLYLCCLMKMSFVDLLFQYENYFALKKRPNMENSNFDEELTEFFNKILVRDLCTKSRLVIFCIRSPIKTIKRICEHAIFNGEQLQSCVSDLKMLKTACLLKNFASLEEPELDIISSVLCEMIDSEDYGPGEKSRLIGLIQRLQKKETLGVNIEQFVLNMIHEQHSLANYDKMEFALEILRLSIRANLIRSNEIVLLAFFSQLLNQTSWSCSTFTTKLVRIRELLISCIHTMLNNSKFPANDAGLVWLRNEVMKTGDVNRIHFCELWHSYGYELPISNELYAHLFTLTHARTKLKSTIEYVVKSFRYQKLQILRVSFTAAFIQILPILTYRGWTKLMTHVKAILYSWLDCQRDKSDTDMKLMLFRMFTTSLYALAQDMNQNQDMQLCFSYCLRNFGRMIQETFSADRNLKYEAAVVFVEELLFLINGIQDLELRKEMSISLSPVIFGIVNLAKKNTSGEAIKITDLENWYKKDFIGEIGIEALNFEY